MLKAKINSLSKLTSRTTEAGLQQQSPKTYIAKSNASDLFTAEFEINDARISARNVLTKGQTHDEISQYSGASISTRGRYISSSEKAKGFNHSRSLYLFIQSNTQKSVSLAIQKINEIIANDQNQHSNNNPNIRMAKFNTRPPPTMAQQQNSNQANSTFVEKLMIGLEHAPPSFNLREQVIGAGGANLHYIRNETGAIATLRGRGSLFIDPILGTESPEPIHLYIEHHRFDGLQSAKQLAKNLIETLQQEVVHLQQSNPNASTVAFSNSGTIIQQGQSIAQINVPPPMLAVPPPIIQQNQIDQQGNQATIVQQNFIQQNPPPSLGGPPQTVQSQQQTIIHQQIIPQTVPIQLQQSNMVIQQPVQQPPTLGNINIPPPGIPIPIKTGQIVQFQTPPPVPPGGPHLTQPPPNIQLQHQQPATQIVLNHPQSYQYQYIQQPIQAGDPQLQPNQVTIQHIYQPQQQIQGIVQQAQTQPQTQTFEQFQQVRSQQLHAGPPQQYITVQGNTAYMVPPPTIIHQQPTSQHNPHTQVQTQIATSNPNIIFQPPPQLQQLQMHMSQGISVQNLPPPLPPNAASGQENLNQPNASDENANTLSSVKEEQKSDGDQLDSPSRKSPEEKTEGDTQSNDSNGDAGNQTQSTTTAVSVAAPPPPPAQSQTIAIRQPPPSIATTITLPVTQMPPPIMAVPPPMSCVQHFVGNTLITTQPTAQTHTHQIYNQVPVSIQQIPSTGQQIHVSTPNGQHFLVNTTPQWQGGPPPNATLSQQPPIHQISQNGTIQNVQITHQIAHNGTDFRAIPPPTLAGQASQHQTAQQTPLAMTFNPHVQVQFQPQLLQQLPPAQTIDSTQIIGSQMSTHSQQHFNVVQQQPHLSYQQTVMTPFQQQIKQIQYQEQSRPGQKRKHDDEDLVASVNHQPRMGMGQRDQNQTMMHQQQQPQSLHQPPPPMPPTSSHGNLSVAQTMNGSSNNSANNGQDENFCHKSQSDIQQQLGQPPPPPPPLSSGIFSENRSFYQREMNDSFMENSSRQPFDGPMNGMGPSRGPRFHHNNGMMGPGPGFPMRPSYHIPPDGNGNNFPMHRMNFGPPPPPPPYRGDCPPNGYGPPPPRFRGQW